ncbi:MAG: anti-sigma regulatory factor, partial [Desulfobaccales bacterium]
IVWNKAPAPVPAVNTRLTVLEILGLKSLPTRSPNAGAKPVWPQPVTMREVPIRDGNDIIRARQEAREMAQELDFGIPDQIHITTATCEMSRNAYQYSGHGKVTLKPVARNDARGIEIVVEDHGPGIADLSLALQGGSSNDLGYGLPGSKHLMDEFEIQSQVGGGTTVKMIKWLK